MKFWRNLAYSMGNFANTVCYQVFGNRLQFFYLDVLGISPAIIGPLWGIFGVWNAVNNLIMGQLSDRTHTRWGRRIPYIFFGAIPLGISFFLLWTPPAGSPWLIGAYFFVMCFIFDGIFSLLIVAYNALFTEIATDLKARSGLAALREGLAVFALLLAFILAPILSEGVGYVWMGAIIGGFTAVGYMLVLLGAREDPAHMEKQTIGMKQSLRITFANAPFRWYILVSTMKEYVFLILAATLPFWRKYALGITAKSQVFGATLGPGDQEAIMLAVPFLLAIPCLALWNRVTPRIGARRAWMAANLLFVPGLLLMFFARDFYGGLLGTTLIAPGLAGYMMLPIVLLTDIIDEDARRVGERREGIYFGIDGGVNKIAFVFQAILYWAILSGTGYIANATVQNPSAVLGIRFIMAGSPIIAALIGVVGLRFLRVPGVDTERAVSAPATSVS